MKLFGPNPEGYTFIKRMRMKYAEDVKPAFKNVIPSVKNFANDTVEFAVKNPKKIVGGTALGVAISVAMVKIFNHIVNTKKMIAFQNAVILKQKQILDEKNDTIDALKTVIDASQETVDAQNDVIDTLKNK